MERLKSRLSSVCELIVRERFKALEKRATSLGVPQGNFQIISDLNEALTLPPFNQIINQQSSSQAALPIPLVVICDWDGVVSDPWNNNFNLRRLLALRTIVYCSSEFHLYTARVPVNDDSLLWRKGLAKCFEVKPIARFPFLTKENIEKLRFLFEKAHWLRSRHTPQKDTDQYHVYLHPGASKVLGRKGPILDIAIEVLGKGQPLVIIGSSESDRIQVRKVLKESEGKHVDLANLYYFDTGHLLL